MSRFLEPLRRAHPLLVAAFVSFVASVAGWISPAMHGATVVAIVFLTFTFSLCLRGDEAQIYGLSLGGLMDRSPIDAKRLLGDTATAVKWALGVSAVVLPLFGWGFAFWYEPDLDFSWARVGATYDAKTTGTFVDLCLGHLLVVALPEEAFFRGYVQSALDERWGTPHFLLGARVGWAFVATSALFALGHLLATPYPARLAVFFPSLLFGWLRNRTGGIGASVLFHAICNVVAAVLAAGYGFAAA